MKVVYKKKIYNGMAELRDYEVKRFINIGQPVKIIIGEEFMILTPSELKKGHVNNTQHSIINSGQMYKLIGYRWKPTGRTGEQLTIPLDVRTKLSELWKGVNK